MSVQDLPNSGPSFGDGTSHSGELQSEADSAAGADRQNDILRSVDQR